MVAPAQADRDAPFFVVGANRSGTTLLRLLLNAHSRLAVPEEVEFLHGSVAPLAVRDWRRPGLTPDAYAAVVDAFLARAREALVPLDLEALRADVLDGPADLRRPYRLALDAWARHHGKARWGEKTPGNLFYADVLLDMFPGARFVHVVRDPRAGVASMLGASFFPDDVVLNALARRHHHRAGAVGLERHVPAERRMTVRYEDLVEAPEATLRVLCAFLGEPFEPAMLRFHEGAAAFMKPSAVAGHNAAATGPVTAGRVEAWRDRLGPSDVAVVERVCAGEMAAFGYAAEAPSCPPGRRVEAWAKAAYSRLQRWRHPGVRHYTVRHVPFGRLRARLGRGPSGGLEAARPAGEGEARLRT